MRDQLLAEIDAFLARNPAVSATRLGVESVNDTSLIHRLRAGKDCRMMTVVRIRDAMTRLDAERVKASEAA